MRLWRVFQPARRVLPEHMLLHHHLLRALPVLLGIVSRVSVHRLALFAPLEHTLRWERAHALSALVVHSQRCLVRRAAVLVLPER